MHGVRCHVVHRRSHPAQSFPIRENKFTNYIFIKKKSKNWPLLMENDRRKPFITISTSNDVSCHFAGYTSGPTGCNVQYRGDFNDVSAYLTVGVELFINCVVLQ